LNRFVYGRARPADLDRTFAKPTWPNHGWTQSKTKKTNGDFIDTYLKKKEGSILNKTFNVERPRRALSNAKPVNRLPKDIQEKIEENRRALRERVEIINYMRK